MSGQCNTYCAILASSEFRLLCSTYPRVYDVFKPPLLGWGRMKTVNMCCELESQQSSPSLFLTPIINCSQSYYHETVPVGLIGLAVAYSLGLTRSLTLLTYQQVLHVHTTSIRTLSFTLPNLALTIAPILVHSQSLLELNLNAMERLQVRQ